MAAGRSRWRRDGQSPGRMTASKAQSTSSKVNVSSKERIGHVLSYDEQLVVPKVERRDTKTQALATSNRLQTPGTPHDAISLDRTVPPHTLTAGVSLTQRGARNR